MVLIIILPVMKLHQFSRWHKLKLFVISTIRGPFYYFGYVETMNIWDQMVLLFKIFLIYHG